MTSMPEHHTDHRAACVTALRGGGANLAVVTKNASSGHRGKSIAAFYSVSADLPTILACLNTSGQTAGVLATSGLGNGALLQSRQKSIAQEFSASDNGAVADHFDHVAWGPVVRPEIDGAMIFRCRSVSGVPSTAQNKITAHVHTIKNPNLAPLAYLNGGCHHVVPITDR